MVKCPANLRTPFQNITKDKCNYKQYDDQKHQIGQQYTYLTYINGVELLPYGFDNIIYSVGLKLEVI